MSKKSIRFTITQKMLKKAEQDAELGYTTPYSYWRDVMSDSIPELEELSVKDRHSLKMKASENLSRVIYTTGDLEEAEAMVSRTRAEIEAMQAKLLEWAKDNPEPVEPVAEHIITIQD